MRVVEADAIAEGADLVVPAEAELNTLVAHFCSVSCDTCPVTTCVWQFNPEKNTVGLLVVVFDATCQALAECCKVETYCEGLCLLPCQVWVERRALIEALCDSFADDSILDRVS